MATNNKLKNIFDVSLRPELQNSLFAHKLHSDLTSTINLPSSEFNIELMLSCSQIWDLARVHPFKTNSDSTSRTEIKGHFLVDKLKDFIVKNQNLLQNPRLKNKFHLRKILSLFRFCIFQFVN